ncbi:transcriptional regulator, propionate catabolism operon regulatory protein [Alteribacillus persepolensis]|uniref:Transcriptional regulator, propionate catabolism operon regulatory protein n=1 Tax=Alteribacillus persepolensis TaxID=568899 RepID=A0A1G8AW83_9BACI|nr:sigma 54-interacting transcriptional regulator [Alteribacillus persepolensis]SDH25157.1 transcriptional regulator, propionate catabolism operon regulatory protein [Alteribacillus persepolensis]
MHPKIYIVGFPQFSDLARENLKTLPPWLDYQIKELPLELLENDSSIEKLQSLFEPGAVIISGVHLARYLKKRISNFIIPVRVTTYDLLKVAERTGSKDIVVMNYGDNINEIYKMSYLLHVRIRQIAFNTKEEAYQIFKELKEEGVTFVAGGSWVCENAKDFGLDSIFYYSPRAISAAFNDAMNILRAYRSELEKMTLFKTILDINRSGIISTDSDLTVRVINKMTEQLLGIKSQHVVGKHLYDLVPSLQEKQLPSESGTGQFHIIFEHHTTRFIADMAPIDLNGELMGYLLSINTATSIQKAEQKIRKNITKRPMTANYHFDDIIGSSAAVQDTKQQARKFSSEDSSILIHGESGTGKELFAQSIHNASPRKNQPFVAVNCAALPENLIDSELFGYEEGSFTGARKGGKTGLFELAHQGTIFLDEISELPLHLQSRLLRVLQEEEIVRVGGNQIIPVDVRIITASNKNLLDCIKEGRFREDLYFRISVLPLYIPPLREREHDIVELFQFFIRNNKALHSLDLDLLLQYHWPGNIRELENVAKRFEVLCKGETLTSETVQRTLYHSLFPSHALSPFEEYEQQRLSESEQIKQALHKANGNKEQAAKLLGISRTTLWRRMKENHLQL